MHMFKKIMVLINLLLIFVSTVVMTYLSESLEELNPSFNLGSLCTCTDKHAAKIDMSMHGLLCTRVWQ